MKARDLRTVIFSSFMTVILLLGVSAGALGFYLVKRNVIDRAQEQVTNDLATASNFFSEEINNIGAMLRVACPDADPRQIRDKAGLHYAYRLTGEEVEEDLNPLARKALSGEAAGGVRVVRRSVLENRAGEEQLVPGIPIRETPRSREKEKELLEDLMVKEYAVPVPGEGATSVLVGGRIMNRDHEFADKIRDLVFGDRTYAGRPMGTVTVFQEDVRIATNVLDAQGERALGTRVSREVYENVVTEGRSWLDRAFVVKDWYITAYEPIRDPAGEVVGIFYVGILEKPFQALGRNTLLMYLAIMIVAATLAGVVSFFITRAVDRPVTALLEATGNISEGRLETMVEPETSIAEFNELAGSFNNMARKLNESYGRLKVSNEKLEALNKRYLDLIGFVSHELKGILSSTILNAYAVRDGFLGMVNFKQQKALDSVARNLDHLDSTVKNFLSLSRIERGRMKVEKTPILLKEEIFDVAVDTFAKRISSKDMNVRSDIPEDLKIEADKDLIKVVANNLLSNAIKYGHEKGDIVISAALEGPKTRIGVYNDGRPITDEEKKKLFKRFSRLEGEEAKKEKGTGLGLFITKEIIESHGGRIGVRGLDKGNEFFFTV